MKFQSALWLGALSALVAAKNVKPGVVQYDFVASKGAEHPNPKYRRMYENILSKRAVDNTVEVTLNNELYAYYSVDIEVGTPGQQLKLLMDTGSSDIWMISTDNPYCTTDQQEINSGDGIDCSESGTFEPSKSSTFEKNDTSQTFFIQYGDLTYAQGEWFTDVLSLGDVTIKQMTMGLGTQANSSQGVFGIGFPALEASNVGQLATASNADIYPNFPQQLVIQGYTAQAAYSLWLNDLFAPSGSILFGGVDHAKYTPPLLTVPVVRSTEAYPEPIEMTIVLDSMVAGKTSIINSPTIALLDSGSTLMALPSDAVNALVSLFDASYYSNIGFYVSTCISTTDTGKITFDFSGAVIDVPYSQVLFPLISTSGAQLTFKNGDPACALAVTEISADEGKIILGDSFLRSAYVVYDLENFEISLAQTVFNASDSDIEAILSTVPSASPASLFSSTQGVSLASGDVTFEGGNGQPTDTAGTSAVQSGSKIITRSLTGRTSTAAGAATGASSSSESSETGSSSSSSPSSNSGAKYSVGLGSLILTSLVFGMLL